MPPRPTAFLNSHSGLIAPSRQHSGENRGDTAAQVRTWDLGSSVYTTFTRDFVISGHPVNKTKKRVGVREELEDAKVAL